jgi:hypothetical protein
MIFWVVPVYVALERLDETRRVFPSCVFELRRRETLRDTLFCFMLDFVATNRDPGDAGYGRIRYTHWRSSIVVGAFILLVIGRLVNWIFFSPVAQIPDLDRSGRGF